MPLAIINTLYYTLINPLSLYGIEVWHGANANITNKTFTLPKKMNPQPFILCLSILTQTNTLKMQKKIKTDRSLWISNLDTYVKMFEFKW